MSKLKDTDINVKSKPNKPNKLKNNKSLNRFLLAEISSSKN